MARKATQLTVGQILFRYREVVHASLDYDGDIDDGTGRVALSKEEYVVTSVTPKGAWISPRGWYWRPKFKFMLGRARKRFAHDNERDALESYIARQKRRIEILEHQLSKSRRGMALAKTKLEEFNNDQQQKTTEPSS